MTSRLDFVGAVHQNLYLAAGAREVHAVVTVDARLDPGGSATMSATQAEVLILDCSGSMGVPAEKIVRAKEAASAVIDELRDGVWFALVAGSDDGRMIWPATPSLAVADPQNRAKARDAVKRLDTAGSTRIGAWLRLVKPLLSAHPEAIRHAILLTDGRNQYESSEELSAAVRDCEGLFSCDCRGIGTDWSVDELRMISSALGGTVDLVVEPADLAKDLRAMVATSMHKAVADVRMRLRVPVGATVRFVKQTAPTLVDLSARRIESGERTGDYPTGAWGTESRDYHLCIELDPGEVGEEKCACWLRFVQASANGTEQELRQVFQHTEPDGSATDSPDEGRVRALWTDDLALSTVTNDKVAVVTGRAEAARLIQDGLAALEHGETDRANECFSRAWELAVQLHEQVLMDQILRLYDPAIGTFLQDQRSAEEEMSLDIESTRTTPLHRD